MTEAGKYLENNQGGDENAMSHTEHSFEGKSDKEVWDAFRAGHEGAFASLYDCYFDILYNYGFQLVKDKGLVEDVLQDFFLELRVKRAKLSEVERVKAYLIKSFRRKVLKQVKKDQNLIVDIEGNHEAFNISLQSDFQFIKTQFDEHQQLRIAKILNGLTRREREAIYYFYFEDLSYTDISQVMGLNSSKSARNLIYKALSTLKEKKDILLRWVQFTLMFWV